MAEGNPTGSFDASYRRFMEVSIVTSFALVLLDYAIFTESLI